MAVVLLGTRSFKAECRPIEQVKRKINLKYSARKVYSIRRYKVRSDAVVYTELPPDTVSFYGKNVYCAKCLVAFMEFYLSRSLICDHRLPCFVLTSSTDLV